MVDALDMQEAADGYLQNVETDLRKLQAVGDEMIESWLVQETAWLAKVLDQRTMRGQPSPYQVAEQHRERKHT